MELKCFFLRLSYLYARLTIEEINKIKIVIKVGISIFETLIDLEEPVFDGIIIIVKYLHLPVVFVEHFKEPPPSLMVVCGKNVYYIYI